MQRSIYTAEQLSMQKYIHDRNRLKMSMQTASIESKKIQLQKYLQPSSSMPPWTFINDFIQFLHLIENTDADFVLLEQLMDQFKLINVKNLRNSNIGAILMKMLHHFRRDESAQKVLNQDSTKRMCDCYFVNSSLILCILFYSLILSSFTTIH